MPAVRSRVSPARIATQLADQQSLWRSLVRYDPASRYYTRLAAEHEFEAWLLTWLPGQGTEWHDHGGSAGAFVVLQGSLSEAHAEVAPGRPPRILAGPRRLGAGSLRPFGRQHVHRVTNHELEPAVSLHVYAPALVEMNSYEAHGDLLRLVASQREGRNW